MVVVASTSTGGDVCVCPECPRYSDACEVGKERPDASEVVVQGQIKCVFVTVVVTTSQSFHCCP